MTILDYTFPYYVCRKYVKPWYLWNMDIVKNVLTTLNVADFWKVNGVKR
jgi:hypothetical protein